MPSFELTLDEKSLAGSRFVAQVRDEIQRAVFTEKERRRLTQQAIADRLDVNRSVVNRQVTGLENMTARSIGELLWAIGWVPHFEAREPVAEDGQNEIPVKVTVEPPKITAPEEPPRLGRKPFDLRPAA